MVLDSEIKNQLIQYLELLEENIIFGLSVVEDENSKKILDLVSEISALSPKISVKKQVNRITPSFTIDSESQISGISFAGLPLGHEFTSLVLALLQVSGREPKIDKGLIDTIKSIEQPLHFETYVSLTCQNCPDVVQALNIMSVLNPNISHTMIEGGMFKETIEAKNILAVPTVYLNGEVFSSGRMSLEQILEKVSGSTNKKQFDEKEEFDVLVVGGGPAGASSAIYASRKGIRTGIITDHFGGQVTETLGIENFIGTKYIEGPKLMAQIENHVREYPIDLMTNQKVTNIEKNEMIELTLSNGGKIKSKTIILATGARWKNIGIPGEIEFKNKGVAYCPHCDGPLFADKDIVVVGGGNSGVEAAIDLAGIVNKVTVLEFMPELKADEVLQKRLYSLPNVTVLTNVQIKEILGDEKVTGVIYSDRETSEEVAIDAEGVFVLIGLIPNTDWLPDGIEKTKYGEIIVNEHGSTNVPGIFAAGDCTNTAYKQIIISMGSGATAALGAFDYLIRD